MRLRAYAINYFAKIEIKTTSKDYAVLLISYLWVFVARLICLSDDRLIRQDRYF